MIDNAVLLARVQFAFTMAFHIVFPSFTIRLAEDRGARGALDCRPDATVIINWPGSGPRFSLYPSLWESCQGWSCRTS